MMKETEVLIETCRSIIHGVLNCVQLALGDFLVIFLKSLKMRGQIGEDSFVV